jgi:copper chaperone CopZ
MKTIKVNGMSCKHCVASVTETLEKIAHVKNISIDLATGLVHYETSGDVAVSDIKNAISKIGFTPAD